jgi:hypothetical protein
VNQEERGKVERRWSGEGLEKGGGLSAGLGSEREEEEGGRSFEGVVGLTVGGFSWKKFSRVSVRRN